MTPHYLFSLECFTHTLPESQAEVLCDNIQYLTDPDEDPDSLKEDGPQVFLLSGYGQPGSVIIDLEEGNEAQIRDSSSAPGSRGESEEPLTPGSSGISQDRRHWTCWCAAHRPNITRPQSKASRSSTVAEDKNSEASPPENGLIILEFELERDIYNPLYPPPDASSREHISPAPSSSDGVSMGGRTVGGDSMSSERTTKSDGPSPSGVGTPTTGDPGEKFRLPPKHPGLEGDEDWMPSPEAILASTTNKAKPIKALERMRRLERATHQRLLDQVERGDRHKLKGLGDRPSGGAGTLEVFAVLAQVNEQLSAAPDLQTFLDVVVGVTKDLTQFHRVLVYQFDENDNGLVSSAWGGGLEELF